MKPEVEIALFNGEQATTTTSLNVAGVFGKRHDNLLQTIRNMECSEEFRLLNFKEATYADDQGKDRPMYIMTRDGFTLLVMGFTGKKAMAFKEAYIKAFNRMEQKLKKLQTEEQKRIAIREAGKLARRTMTDEIRDSGENERMHGHGYSTYTQLSHKVALGENLNATKKRLGVSKKENVRDRLNSDELKQLDAVEGTVRNLLAMGLKYDAVKAVLETMQTRRKELA